ncbi:MAG: fasciclin domain-containing protein [bacterium]
MANMTSQENDALKRSPKSQGAPAPTDMTIVELAQTADLYELVDALTYVDTALNAGLIPTLSGTDQYTVFAPTNEAFENLYEALDVDAITDLPATLVRDVLLYHVTEGRRASNSVVPKNGLRKIETLLEESFYVNPDAEIIAIGNMSQIVDPDYSASNGIVHLINAVLLPIETEE